MAAVQISNLGYPGGNPTGRFGPFQDSNGNLWVYGINISNNNPCVYKSNDGGSTWSTHYDNTLGGSYLASAHIADCVFDSVNGIIYVLICSPITQVILNKFTIATTTWANVTTSGTPPTSGSPAPGFLTRRSTGEFVVFYQGPTHSLMGNPYRACYYARCSAAGVWSSGVEVSGAVKGTHYDCKSACIGVSDRVHMIFDSGTTHFHRSVSSVNVLDTLGSTNSNVGGNSDIHSIYYDASLGKIVTRATQYYISRANSVANPTWADDSNVSIAEIAYCSSIFIYEPTGAKLYEFYREPTTDDLYFNTTSTTTWGTAAQQDVCTAVTGISVGLICNTPPVISPGTDTAAVFGSTGSIEQRAQSFLFSTGCNLKNVFVDLRKISSPTDNVVIEIQTDSGGHPSGSVVGTVGTISGSSITTSIVSYTLSCDIALSGGTTYWLVLRRSGSLDATNYYSTTNISGAAISTSMSNYQGGWTSFANYALGVRLYSIVTDIGVVFNDSGVYFDKLSFVTPVPPTTQNEKWFAVLQ